MLTLTACSTLPVEEKFPPVSYAQAQKQKVAFGIQPLLINGVEVDKAKWPHVVRISSNGASCTATVIGERALITAAHCAADGGTVSFKVGATTVNGKVKHSPLYKSKDHDIAIAYLDKRVTSFKPASIAALNTQQKGKRVRLIGYGCIQKGGGGGNDGILRMGMSQIVGFSGFDLVTRMGGGAALCFGDSGGPVFDEGNPLLQVAVNSKGNIQDTSYVTRLDVQESHDFLSAWAKETGAGICGLTQNCAESQPPPPDSGTYPFSFSDSKIQMQGTVKVLKP
jgi:hypothetical protein